MNLNNESVEKTRTGKLAQVAVERRFHKVDAVETESFWWNVILSPARDMHLDRTRRLTWRRTIEQFRKQKAQIGHIHFFKQLSTPVGARSEIAR